MENKAYNKLGKWVGITIMFVIGTILSRGIINEYKLSNNHRWTVATTTGWDAGFVNFEFNVKGVMYEGANKGLNLKTKHGKYFVKYYALDPSLLAKVISDEEVTDCIGEPPSDGWADIPTCK
jgi:hypothetical protein